MMLKDNVGEQQNSAISSSDAETPTTVERQLNSRFTAEAPSQKTGYPARSTLGAFYPTRRESSLKEQGTLASASNQTDGSKTELQTAKEKELASIEKVRAMNTKSPLPTEDDKSASKVTRPLLGGFRSQRTEATPRPKMSLSPFHRTLLMPLDLTPLDREQTESPHGALLDLPPVSTQSHEESQPATGKKNQPLPEAQAEEPSVDSSLIEQIEAEEFTESEASISSAEAREQSSDDLELPQDAVTVSEASDESPASPILGPDSRDGFAQMASRTGDMQRRPPTPVSEERAQGTAATSSQKTEVQRSQRRTPDSVLRTSARTSESGTSVAESIRPSKSEPPADQEVPPHPGSPGSPFETTAEISPVADTGSPGTPTLSGFKATSLEMQARPTIPSSPVSDVHQEYPKDLSEVSDSPSAATEVELRQQVQDNVIASSPKPGEFVPPPEHHLSAAIASKVILEPPRDNRGPSINIKKININVVNSPSKAEEPRRPSEPRLLSESKPSIGTERFEILDRNYLTKLKFFT